MSRLASLYNLYIVIYSHLSHLQSFVVKVEGKAEVKGNPEGTQEVRRVIPFSY